MSPASDADIATRVARSFDRAVAERSDQAMIALRDATIALATAVRATLLPPERAVIFLKAILRGHGSAGWAPSIAAEHRGIEPGPETQVYGKLFAWWVRAYYEEPTPDMAPRTARRHGAPA